MEDGVGGLRGGFETSVDLRGENGEAIEGVIVVDVATRWEKWRCGVGLKVWGEIGHVLRWNLRSDEDRSAFFPLGFAKQGMGFIHFFVPI